MFEALKMTREMKIYKSKVTTLILCVFFLIKQRMAYIEQHQREQMGMQLQILINK
jgi:hypothetical protein